MLYAFDAPDSITFFVVKIDGVLQMHLELGATLARPGIMIEIMGRPRRQAEVVGTLNLGEMTTKELVGPGPLHTLVVIATMLPSLRDSLTAKLNLSLYQGLSSARRSRREKETETMRSDDGLRLAIIDETIKLFPALDQGVNRLCELAYKAGDELITKTADQRREEARKAGSVWR